MDWCPECGSKSCDCGIQLSVEVKRLTAELAIAEKREEEHRVYKRLAENTIKELRARLAENAMEKENIIKQLRGE